MRQQVTCAFCGQPTDIMPGTGHEGIDRLKRHYATIDGRRRECPAGALWARLSRATVQRIPALRERQAQRAGVARLQRRLMRYQSKQTISPTTRTGTNHERTISPLH